MSNSRRELVIQNVLDFMEVIYMCHSSTYYVNDRTLYAQDLVVAMGWIVRLRSGDDVEDVISEIKSSETDKHFGDYWKQGEWGDKEMLALKRLKDAL